MNLELWFDFACPYAYLASRRAPTLGVAVAWRPMLLGGVFRGIGAGDGPMATQSVAKARHNVADMHRWAARFGEPFQLPAAHPMRTVRALRVLLALPEPRWPAAIEAIYAAYWQRAEDVTQDAVLAAALRGAGFDDRAIAAALDAAGTEPIKQALRQRTDEAIALGIFGAPAWVVRRPDPLLIWGQDRLPWLDAVLAGWDPDAGPPPGGPRPLAPTGRARAGVTLDVYFDVSSPFAYLGLTQLPALAATGVTPRLVPILLGGLFREIGQADVPLLAMPPPKMRYVAREMQWWARWWGVAFDPPTRFPQRTVTAQRLTVLAAERGWQAQLALALALGRAMWAEQQDLEDDATLARILAREGFPAGWLAATRTPEVKARLAANTAAARDAGVFGVPTWVIDGRSASPGGGGPAGGAGVVPRGIDERALYWGQDRLDLVADAVTAPATSS